MVLDINAVNIIYMRWIFESHIPSCYILVIEYKHVLVQLSC